MTSEPKPIKRHRHIDDRSVDPPQDLAALSKHELHGLADKMLLGDTESRDLCIEFLLLESRGISDGRCRALIARRLKHCPITPEQKRTIVDRILQRLIEGRFSEGFKDQLRLVRVLDRPRLLDTARDILKRPGYYKPYLRPYGEWLLRHEPPLPPKPRWPRKVSLP